MKRKDDNKKKGEQVAVDQGATTKPDTAVAEVPAVEERKPLLAKDDFEYLMVRAARIAKQLLGSLGNTVRIEEEGAVPEAERLQRNADGTIAKVEVDRLITSWESANGGEGSAANLLDREAHKHYKDNELFTVIRYRELVDIVGKNWGITLQELQVAVGKKKESEVVYQALLDRRDDGESGACTRCARASIERMFQPTVSFIVVRGERLLDRQSGKPIVTGNFRLQKVNGELQLVVECPSCKEEVRNRARQEGIKMYHYPRAVAEEKLGRAKLGRQQAAAKDAFDDEAFAGEKARRDRQNRGRSPWGNGSRGGDRGGRSQRDQRRGGNGAYSARTGDSE
ncbi:MAG: hypothetical protein Q7S66_06150 [bacterium]|nr:hypothetical protein [bacterium]